MILSMTVAGDIALTVFLFVVGLFLTIKGGDWFVDSASTIARLTGVPSFIIGATIVSVGTTLPELITSSIAAAEGNVDIAIGNAVGSVNVNIGVIMALSIMFMPHPFDKKTYLFKGLTMITSVAVLFLLCLNGRMNAWLSLIMLAIFAAFTAENIVSGKRQLKKTVLDDFKPFVPSETPDPEPGKPAEDEGTRREKRTAMIKSVFLFLLGALFIVGGARHLVTYGSRLAVYMKIPERIIAITLVAIGTSLPELVTTITSIVKKTHDLSIGNIIGANVIDLCLILPVCAMISGGVLNVPFKSLYIDLPFCIGFAVLAIIPAILFKKFTRAQGVALVAVYVTYLALSIVL